MSDSPKHRDTGSPGPFGPLGPPPPPSGFQPAFGKVEAKKKDEEHEAHALLEDMQAKLEDARCCASLLNPSRATERWTWGTQSLTAIRPGLCHLAEVWRHSSAATTPCINRCGSQTQGRGSVGCWSGSRQASMQNLEDIQPAVGLRSSTWRRIGPVVRGQRRREHWEKRCCPATRVVPLDHGLH